MTRGTSPPRPACSSYRPLLPISLHGTVAHRIVRVVTVCLPTSALGISRPVQAVPGPRIHLTQGIAGREQEEQSQPGVFYVPVEALSWSRLLRVPCWRRRYAVRACTAADSSDGVSIQAEGARLREGWDEHIQGCVAAGWGDAGWRGHRGDEAAEEFGRRQGLLPVLFEAAPLDLRLWSIYTAPDLAVLHATCCRYQWYKHYSPLLVRAL